MKDTIIKERIIGERDNLIRHFMSDVFSTPI